MIQKLPALALLLLACNSDADGPDTGTAADGGAATDGGAVADGGADGGTDGGSTETPVGSNSNTCLADLGSLQGACPADGETALPDEACCAAFEQFQQDSCGCSPLVELVMGETESGESQLERTVSGLGLYCPTLGFDLIEPDCSSELALSGISSGAGHSYNSGTCEQSDWELDALRFQSVLNFNEWFATWGSEPQGCVDYETLLADFAVAFDPDAEDGETPYIDVPYGIGRYKTLKNMVEYLAIILPDINKDAWRFLAETTQSDDSMLYFEPDGSRIYVGTHATVRGYEDCVDSVEGYYETISSYADCSTTIHSMSVPVTSEVPTQLDRVTAIPDLVSDFYQAGSNSDTWGAMDICMSHEMHCTGENRQFESYDACMAFMTSLPVVSPACQEEGKVLGGDSLLCRFKHHFMIPFEPEAHCFHIGTGDPDVYDHIKCVDTECTDPTVQGGPMDWLTLTPTSEVEACIAAADAVSTNEDGSPAIPWATGMVCE